MKEIEIIAEAMLEKKASGVISLDLRKTGTAITDYFVICNAGSSTQVCAIADCVEDRMIEKCRQKVLRTQGRENGFWIIMDYGHIVVHIFQTEYRNFYRLEELWADSGKKEYKDEE